MCSFVILKVGRIILALMKYVGSCRLTLIGPQNCFIFNSFTGIELSGKILLDVSNQSKAFPR